MLQSKRTQGGACVSAGMHKNTTDKIIYRIKDMDSCLKGLILQKLVKVSTFNKIPIKLDVFFVNSANEINLRTLRTKKRLER